MALIKCPECNKEVSDKAPACIHCGNPLNVRPVQGKAIFKATVSNVAILTHFKILNGRGEVLAKVKLGESYEINIDKDTKFTVKWSGIWGAGKDVTAYANEINRFSMGINAGGLGYYVSKVDTITSE